MLRQSCFVLILTVVFATFTSDSMLSAADFPAFEATTLDPNVGNVCYALTTADVDGDGKTDLVAVTENRVVWFHNPDWKLRVIIADQTEKDNVCIAPFDIDRDGQIDFALGAGWLNGKNLGTIQWLSRGASLEDKWHVHLIGSESWTHRMRWGDFLNTGVPQLVVSPLNKTVGDGVRLTAFEIPTHPKTLAWKRTVLDDSMNAMHAHAMGDFDGDNKLDVLCAAQEGVFLLQRDRFHKIIKTQIGVGASDPEKPTGRGAGEIKSGKLKNGRRFVVTVEPMHGHSVAVYTEPTHPLSTSPQPAGLWKRHVLDDTLKWGHAVWTADIDRDGSDEIVIGQRDKGTGPITGPGVYVYDIDDIETTGKGAKHVIDNGGVACEDALAFDFNDDGWPDIAAGGRATHNVKLYINKGAK